MRRLWRVLLLISVLPYVGCAAPYKSEPPPDDVPLAESSSAELFQKRSDASMLQAAVARWQDGDVAGCRMLLERLLKRNADCLEARFLLADLLVSENNSTEAENHLRWIVQHHPQNPQAQHSLGMLLVTSGRADEAMQYLQAASRLEPDNKLYSLCQDAAKASEPNLPPVVAGQSGSKSVSSASHP